MANTAGYYQSGCGPIGRVFVRNTSSDLTYSETFFTDNEIKNLEKVPLICRTERSGQRNWFKLQSRHPTEADIFNPIEAAGLQLGLYSRLIHLEPWRVTSFRISLKYFYDVISAADFFDLYKLVRCMRTEVDAKRFAISLEITSQIARLLERGLLPRDYVDLGMAIGLRFVVRKNIESFESSWLSWDSLRNSSSYDECLSELSSPTVSKEKLHWLVMHPLEMRGSLADFRSETISTIEAENMEWQRRRAVDFLSGGDRRFESTEYQEILTLLQGRFMTAEEIAACLDVSVRGLHDNISKSKSGKQRQTRGRLSVLSEAGLIGNNARKGGYFLTAWGENHITFRAVK